MFTGFLVLFGKINTAIRVRSFYFKIFKFLSLLFQSVHLLSALFVFLIQIGKKISRLNCFFLIGVTEHAKFNFHALMNVLKLYLGVSPFKVSLPKFYFEKLNLTFPLHLFLFEVKLGQMIQTCGSFFMVNFRS